MSNYKISILPYQKRWKTDFESFRNWFLENISDGIIEVHHVGSTSIEGLSAKPVIDIDIEIEREKYEVVKQDLEKIGYKYKELGIVDRNAFKYLGDKDLVKHNLYVCPSDSSELARHLAFRDYLREHRSDMERYRAIKFDSIKQGNDHIVEYMDHKGELVGEILLKAMKWAGITPESEITCDDCGNKIIGEYKIHYLGDGFKRVYFSFDCKNCEFSTEVDTD